MARRPTPSSLISTQLGDEEVNRGIKRDEETWVYTGEVEYRFTPQFEMALGVSYGDYDFASSIGPQPDYSDALLTSGRQYLVSGLGGRYITRTYYAEARWKIRKELTARIVAELDHSEVTENQDADEYYRLAGSLVYRF